MRAPSQLFSLVGAAGDVLSKGRVLDSTRSQISRPRRLFNPGRRCLLFRRGGQPASGDLLWNRQRPRKGRRVSMAGNQHEGVNVQWQTRCLAVRCLDAAPASTAAAPLSKSLSRDGNRVPCRSRRDSLQWTTISRGGATSGSRPYGERGRTAWLRTAALSSETPQFHRRREVQRYRSMRTLARAKSNRKKRKNITVSPMCVFLC